MTPYIPFMEARPGIEVHVKSAGAVLLDLTCKIVAHGLLALSGGNEDQVKVFIKYFLAVKKAGTVEAYALFKPSAAEYAGIGKGIMMTDDGSV